NSSYDGARELAAWKQRMREQWPGVRVDHVESSGLDKGVEIGGTVGLRAYVSLGTISPADVAVQVLHGRLDEADEIHDPQMTELSVSEEYEAGRHRYEGSVPLDRTGQFGYTVRVVPKHELLASPVDLGLTAAP